MMKTRRLVTLAVVLVGLALLSTWQHFSRRRAASHSDTAPVLSQEIDASKLQRLAIGYGPDKEAVVLANGPDGWTVATAYGHKASQQKVDNLLNNLKELNGEYRSDTADVLADYGFSDSTTVTIAGYVAGSEDPYFTLEVGKKPPRSGGNFIKVPASSTVYLTRQGILGSLGLYSGPGEPESKTFLDLDASTLERNDVDGITTHDGDAVLAIVKEFPPPTPAPADTDSTAGTPEIDRSVYEWRITKPHEKAAMKTRADAILSSVCTLRAVDIDNPDGDPAAYGLDHPQKWAEVQMHDGSTVTIEFGATREEAEGHPGGIYMRVSGDPSIYIVKDYLLNNIFKKYEDLLPENKT